MFDRYPLLLHPSIAGADPRESYARHEPIRRREHLIRRGQDAGEFDRSLSTGWLLAATMALGHAAGDEVAAGRLSSTKAATMLREGVFRLYGA